MKRKIIKLGTATLVASIPSKWIKKFNLKSGDEVEVVERGNELVISTEKHSDSQHKDIDITNLDTKLVARYIISAYILGYDEIKLRFENHEVLDIKTKNKVMTISLIQSIVNTQLIGMEIIEQKTSYCMLKDITGISENEFDRIIRRVFLLIMSMSEELLNNVKDNKKNKIKEIVYTKENINRFINFCLRILNKKGHTNFQKTPVYYHIIMQLRHITEIYSYIGKEFEKRNKEINKDIIKAFEDINKAFKIYYELFYKYDKDKAVDLVKSIRGYYDKVNPIQYSEKPIYSHDAILIGRLTMISVELLNLAELRITVEL